MIYCIFAQSSWILVFFLKHKITNFRELLFYYKKKFKQLLHNISIFFTKVWYYFLSYKKIFKLRL